MTSKNTGGIDMDTKLSTIGFARQSADPTDQEVYDMVDEVIYQTLGPKGLGQIIKPGDRVALKVNVIGPSMGARGEKGRGIITDPRIVRHVAGLVRDIIGFDSGGSLKVVDTVMYADAFPSLKREKSSFYWARLNRTDDNAVNAEDYCYDYDADGILDGGSEAQLVNLESIGEEGRQLFEIKMAEGHTVKVAFPKFLRTKEQAAKTDTPDEYTDVFIGLPIFKSHGLGGITGSLKLHYGIRSMSGMEGDPGRFGHSGMYFDEAGRHNTNRLMDYLCAQHLVRSYDYTIMDCLTANRKGPTLPQSGISYIPDHDQAVDYILSSAIIASLDPVALDTVESSFAGYEQSSIPILETAGNNKLGQNDPAFIDIVGKSDFGIHRKFLWDKYNQGDEHRYPLEDGWGGAHALSTVEPNYFLYLTQPEVVSDGVLKLDYKVIRADKGESRKIVRVELFGLGTPFDYHVGENLEEGSFTVDMNKMPGLKHFDMSFNAFAWDDTFNCVPSMERFVMLVSK